MKISKKIGYGLAIVLTALASIHLLHGSALAAVNPNDVAGATYSFQDGANIIGDFGSSGKVTFTDTDPTNSTRNYVPLSGEFCDPGSNVTSKNGVSKNIKFGINIDKSVNLQAIPIHGDAVISAQIKLGIQQGANPCTGQVFAATITNSNGLGGTDFQWDGDTITSFEGVSSQLGFAKDTAAGVTGEIYLAGAGSGACGATDAILLSGPGANTGKYYNLSDANIREPGRASNMADYPALAQTNAVTNKSCHVDSFRDITLAGSQGQNAPGGPNTIAATGDEDSSCEATAGSTLAWIMCPMFSAASALVQSTVNIFENLLSFTVAQDLGNASCKINSQGCQASVKLTWSIIKNIASIILVILMLVMILSQAIGGGPFDAYTIRKLLPKLVAAVIVMQLSWPLVAWVIDIFNDIGNGLQAFLFAPFGGGSTLNDMGKLISHAGIGPAGAAAFNWVVILGAGVATVAALPTALFLAFTSVMGLLVGIVTLIFRKILIIMLLILSPLAIIAWVLPGTQRYWKLWFDNLLKTLAMFPMIVAMVAAGRIFAYIAGPQTSGFDGFTAKFLSLLFVLVGFIGPLFILPRTYKWGGSMMSAAGGAISSAGARVNKGMEQPLKGYGERWQGQRAKEYNPLDKTWKRGLRRIQSGHVLPTERSRRLTIAAGNKWADERNDEANAYVARTQEKALNGYEKFDITRDGEYVQFSRNAQGKIVDARGRVVKNIEDAAIVRRFGEGPAGESAARAANAFVTLTGVEAGKQALVDIAGNDGNSVTDKRAAQAAQKLLIDTHSEIELQNSTIQRGSNAGHRANEVASWKSNITSSPPHYSTINGSRPDMAPDLLESAESAASRVLGKPVTYQDATAAERRVIDVQKSRIAIERLTPEQAAQVHYGFYDDIGRVGAETVTVTDPATGAPRTVSVSQLLAEKLIDFNHAPGTVGRNAVGSLHGGKQEHVDAALAASPYTLNTLP